jgi:serine/threonine protein kinase
VNVYVTIGIGCIIGECITGIPLFTGDSEIGQLFTIFQTTGTPNPQNWPTVHELPDYHSTFPQWRKKGIQTRLELLVKDKIQFVKEQIQQQREQRAAAQQTGNNGENGGAINIDLTDDDNSHDSTSSSSSSSNHRVDDNLLLQPWLNIHYDPLAIDLMEKCLVLDPRDRISAVHALDHPFFHGLDRELANKQASHYEQHLATRMAKRKK